MKRGNERVNGLVLHFVLRLSVEGRVLPEGLNAQMPIWIERIDLLNPIQPLTGIEVNLSAIGARLPIFSGQGSAFGGKSKE